MRRGEEVMGYASILLTMVAVILLWLVNWMLGFTLMILVLGVGAWYLRARRRGDLYLKEVARLTGSRFHEGGLGYGHVSGSYMGRRLEVSVNRGYHSLQGLTGLTLSTTILNSAVGALAGIRNFTSVKLEHKGLVEEPFRIDDRAYVDRHLILYFPPSNRATGLPEMSPEHLATKIDEMVKRAKLVEDRYVT